MRSGRRWLHIEAHDAWDAVQGSIKALRGLGDQTVDPGELSAFAYVEYGKHTGPRGCTRAVIDRSNVRSGVRSP